MSIDQTKKILMTDEHGNITLEPVSDLTNAIAESRHDSESYTDTKLQDYYTKDDIHNSYYTKGQTDSKTNSPTSDIHVNKIKASLFELNGKLYSNETISALLDDIAETDNSKRSVMKYEDSIALRNALGGFLKKENDANVQTGNWDASGQMVKWTIQANND